jgi:hypothetical protein
MKTRLLLPFCFVAFASCATTHHVPGTVEQGGECEYDRDCAPVEGANVYCPCGTCEKTYPLPIQCGPNAVVCKPDETCSSAGGPMGGCVPDAKLGESCATTNCLSGLWCGPGQLCKQAAPVGEACDARVEESCAAPAYCDGLTQKCVQPGAAGAPCDSNRIYRDECQAGTACSIVSNTCVEILENGASCTDDTGCLSGYCTPDGICETRSC